MRVRGAAWAVFALGCSSGSGVDSSKALSALSADEYARVCGWYNAKTQSLVGATCAQPRATVTSVIQIDCSSNPFAATCAAKVSDVEACASKTDACSAIGSASRPAECVLIATCVGGS